MKGILLALLLVSSVSFSLPVSLLKSDSITLEQPLNIMSDIYTHLGLLPPGKLTISLQTIRGMLATQSNINPFLIAKLLTSLKCFQHYNLKHNNILTV